MSLNGPFLPRPVPRLVAVRVAVAGAGLLLFAIQPLAGQLVLPTFGGGPGTWAATLAFFQLALLAGYGYAHWARTRLGSQTSGILHAALALLAVGLALVAPADPALLRLPDLEPALAVLVVHAVTIGPAVVLLAATTPLLTGWLADGRRPHLQSPGPAKGEAQQSPLHRLYAVSNAGALAALLLYPTVVEPSLGLAATRRLWLAGLVVVGGLVGALGLGQAVNRRASRADPGATPPEGPAATGSDARSERALRWRWVLLAALSAGLLNASTTLLTLDLGAIPLLWVLPLAVYLATFILAFSAVGDRLREPIERLAPIATTILWLPFASGGPWSVLPLLGVVLGGLFVVALALHGALAASRPPEPGLPRYYLALATGGALGGSFVGIAAPLLFPDLWELPLLLVGAILVGGWPSQRPARERARRYPDGGSGPKGTLVRGRQQPVPGSDDRTPPRPSWLDAAVWRLNRYILLGIVFLVLLVADGAPGADAAIVWFVVGALVLALGGRPVLLAGATAVALAAAMLATPQPNLFAGRSFFGVLQVRPSPDRSVIQLWNGTTLHGTQPTDPARRREPTGYYVATGPAGDLFRALREESRSRLDVGVVGLGVGGLAAYAETKDVWTFIEIDPLVVRIASDPSLFTYLAAAPTEVRIVVDDGRRALRAVPDATFDLLVLDAFTSDAIPTHLVTAEAIADALRVVRPDGLLAVQLSNRYVDLAPPVAGAADLAAARVLVRDFRPPAEEVAAGAFPSRWLVASRSATVLAALATVGWRPIEPALPLTDDQPDLLRFLRSSFG